MDDERPVCGRLPGNVVVWAPDLELRVRLRDGLARQREVVVLPPSVRHMWRLLYAGGVERLIASDARSSAAVVEVAYEAARAGMVAGCLLLTCGCSDPSTLARLQRVGVIVIPEALLCRQGHLDGLLDVLRPREAELRVGDVRIDPKTRTATLTNGDRVVLSSGELALVAHVARCSPEFCTTDNLAQAVFERTDMRGRNLVWQYLSTLRSKLGADLPLVHARQRGYRLCSAGRATMALDP